MCRLVGGGPNDAGSLREESGAATWELSVCCVTEDAVRQRGVLDVRYLMGTKNIRRLHAQLGLSVFVLEISTGRWPERFSILTTRPLILSPFGMDGTLSGNRFLRRSLYPDMMIDDDGGMIFLRVLYQVEGNSKESNKETRDILLETEVGRRVGYTPNLSKDSTMTAISATDLAMSPGCVIFSGQTRCDVGYGGVINDRGPTIFSGVAFCRLALQAKTGIVSPRRSVRGSSKVPASRRVSPSQLFPTLQTVPLEPQWQRRPTLSS